MWPKNNRQLTNNVAIYSSRYYVPSVVVGDAYAIKTRLMFGAWACYTKNEQFMFDTITLTMFSVHYDDNNTEL